MKYLFWIIVTSSLVGHLSSTAVAAVKGQPKSPGRLISTNVGRVVDHVVTSREVIINNLLERSSFKKQKTKMKALVYQSRPFNREVTAVLIEWAVFLEAKNFASTWVKKAEVENKLSQAVTKLSARREWREYGMSRRELREMIQRKMQAKKFIKFKVDSSAVPVTDEEALTYFKENRAKFGKLPFDNFRDNIKTYLQRQQVDQRLRDWFEILQSKYNVRSYTQS